MQTPEKEKKCGRWDCPTHNGGYGHPCNDGYEVSTSQENKHKCYASRTLKGVYVCDICKNPIPQAPQEPTKVLADKIVRFRSMPMHDGQFRINVEILLGNALSQTLTEVLERICAETESKKWKIQPDFAVSLNSEREQELYNAAKREGENNAYITALSIIKSNMPKK